MDTQVNALSVDKQEEYVANAVSMGLLWGLVQGTFAVIQGQPANEVARVVNSGVRSPFFREVKSAQNRE